MPGLLGGPASLASGLQASSASGSQVRKTCSLSSGRAVRATVSALTQRHELEFPSALVFQLFRAAVPAPTGQ